MGFKTFLKEQQYQDNIKAEVLRCSEEKVSILDNCYRYGSKAFFDTINEARNMDVKDWILETDIGTFHKDVPLDCPMIDDSLNEEEDKELNEPKRGGPKKFYVYVKDGDSIKKVTFGDTTGLKVKFDDEEARKSFVARHKCDQANDKTKASYWSCRLPHYASQLGLSNGGKFFW